MIWPPEVPGEPGGGQGDGGGFVLAVLEALAWMVALAAVVAWALV